MRRGDIVLTVGRGDLANRPRPSLIVQADDFNDHHPAITICPMTSQLTGDGLYRVAITADALNGLIRDSEVEIDRVQAIWRERIARRVGYLPEETMFTVDQALRRWLAL